MGSRKGSLNFKTEALFDSCYEVGIDPFKELLNMAMNGEKEETRLGALKEVCRYLYPQRKAIEHSIGDTKGFKVILEDWTKKE